MSLLIKALANAEKDKQAELNKRQEAEHSIKAKMPLELTPVDEVKSEPLPQAEVVETLDSSLVANGLDINELTLEDEAGLSPLLVAGRQQAKLKASVNSARESKVKSTVADSRSTKVTPAIATAQSPLISNPNQKVAAKAFVANQQTKPSSSKLTLAMLGVAGVLIIWLGFQGYQYIGDLTKPEVAVIRPEPTLATVEDAPTATSAEISATTESIEPNNLDADTVEIADNEIVKASQSLDAKSVFKPSAKVVTAGDELNKIVPNQSVSNAQQVTSSGVNDVRVDQAQSLQQNTSQRIPLKLVSKTPVAGVDPTLLGAYEAFVRGEDDSAQRQYWQVLKRNVRNVDALLGMAAIAQRQGRNADAVGWYQKVLEVEPRNTIAQSAVMSLQASTDVVGTESRIKNMLAQQPDAANLHAALGNIYAAQNQWSTAQQAYFNASRFAPDNADYAFNLAISLDQLGKSSLALVQYQRALELLNSYGASSPDRAQLEARIQALQ